MARQRDYQAEYARRVARGAQLGLTRQEARRGRAPEHPGRPVPPTRRAPPPRWAHTQATGKGGNIFRARDVASKKGARQAAGEIQKRGAGRGMHIFGRRQNGEPFQLGGKGGFSPGFMAQLFKDFRRWAAAMGDLVNARYPGEAPDMGSLEFVSYD